MSHFPGCPCCLGPQPCHHGLVPARCLPPWAAGAPTPAYHSCLRASAWPHCIPGAACPPLFLPLALTGPWALSPPGTGWHPPLSGPPSQGRINRILSQPPVPVWAHFWVGSDGQASEKVSPSEDIGKGPGLPGNWQAGGQASCSQCQPSDLTPGQGTSGLRPGPCLWPVAKTLWGHSLAPES